MRKPRSRFAIKQGALPAALLAITLSAPRLAQGAACCAGSSAAPALISGDDWVQLSATVSRSQVIGDAPAQGLPVFRSQGNAEITQIYRLDGAWMFADRWQTGASIPLIHHSNERARASSTGLGDLRFNLGYEILPEWEYSTWKPKGILFLQATFPTGQSVYDTGSISATDAVGSGFYTFSLGSLWIKRWSSWDAFALPELHYGLPRTFQAADTERTRVSPGFGASLALGGGWSPGGGAFRLGLRIQPVFNQAKSIQISGDGADAATRTSRQLAWESGLDATYVWSDQLSLGASYVDQTLLGPAINSTLSRSFALSLQRRWPR